MQSPGGVAMGAPRQVQEQPQLTSTTAPGKIFDSRSEMADHYRSDYHRYNLRRREAGLMMVREEDFTLRFEAAAALRREREGKAERGGTDHLGKHGKANKKDKKKKKDVDGKDRRRTARQVQGGKMLDTAVNGANGASGVIQELDGASAASGASGAAAMDTNMDEASGVSGIADMVEQKEIEEQEEEEEEEEAPEIDPCQCLFDSHTSATVAENVEHMRKTYSFYVPDVEYLVDLEGLVGYCAEKVKAGRTCLYCQRTFTTWTGCQRHMIDTEHVKILYEAGKDMDEYDVFYDFAEPNTTFHGINEGTFTGALTTQNGDDDDEDEEWEDVSNDQENENMNDEDDDIHEAYHKEMNSRGFDITPLGELIFPDGRIIGHRGLARYYKQRFAPDKGADRAAVQAAREAAGDRLYCGRVVNLRQLAGVDTAPTDPASCSYLAKARSGALGGRKVPLDGRVANGILVADGGNRRGGGFTALSLYRYKAAVKKSRREEFQGFRLQQRTKMNTNRMDKKANRLMNNVSVAHAPR